MRGAGRVRLWAAAIGLAASLIGSAALAGWPEADIAAFARLSRRFADGLLPPLPERW